MKSIRKSLCALVFVIGGGLSGPAKAGIPVIDVANLIQAIQEVLAWAEQYKQMYDQLAQAKHQYDKTVEQYKAVTGIRNLGDIFNNPALKGVVPEDARAIYDGVTAGGYGGLTAAAKATRNALKKYDCSNQVGAARTTCDAAMTVGAQNMAYQGDALKIVSDRVKQIQSLQSAINGTEDPKAIAEMQARLAGELAQVTNDGNRIAVMLAMGEEQHRATEQRNREVWLNVMKPGVPTAASTFHYTP